MSQNRRKACVAKWLSLLTSNQRIPGSNPGVGFIFFAYNTNIYFSLKHHLKQRFRSIAVLPQRSSPVVIQVRFHGYLLFGFFQLKPTPNFLVLLFFLDRSTNSVVKIEASTDDDVRVTKKCLSDHTSFSTLIETRHYWLSHN